MKYQKNGTGKKFWQQLKNARKTGNIPPISEGTFICYYPMAKTGAKRGIYSPQNDLVRVKRRQHWDAQTGGTRTSDKNGIPRTDKYSPIGKLYSRL